MNTSLKHVNKLQNITEPQQGVKSDSCDDAIRQYYRDKIKELQGEGEVGILLPVNKDTIKVLKEEINNAKK